MFHFGAVRGDASAVASVLDDVRAGKRPARRRRAIRPRPELLEGRLAPASGVGASALAPALVSNASRISATLPIEAQYAASEAMGREDSSYATTAVASGFVANNATNGYTATLDASGLYLAAGADAWSLAVQGIGYGGTLHPLGAAATTATANRVEYDYGDVSQWFVNGPLGLQQGFTLDHRPSGGDGLLTVGLALGGDLTATADAGGTSVTLARPGGGASLSYGGLIAYDATGRAMPAFMSVANTAEGQSLSIRVDDAGAQYPLTIDPYIQQAKLSSPIAGDDIAYGWGTSLTSDGETLAVGAPGGGPDAVPGMVYLYTRTERIWNEVGRFASPAGIATDRFGVGVALSGDGSTLAVTAKPGEWQHGPVSLYVYARSGSEWNLTQTVTIEDSNGFGGWLSISDDGGVIAGGAAYADSATGAAYVFTRANGVYTQEPPIVAPDGAPGAWFGEPAALSGDGLTLVVGSGRASTLEVGSGAIYVYQKSDAGWTLAATLGARLGTMIGTKVAVNGDGTVLLAQGLESEEDAGVYRAGFIYTKSGSTWTRTAELVDPDPFSSGNFGDWVALSPDGATAVVSATTRVVDGVTVAGAAYVFTKSGSTWALTQTLTDPDGERYDTFGLGVAIRGRTIAVPSPRAAVGAHEGQGVVFLYDDPQGLAVTLDPVDQTGHPRTNVTFTAAATGAPDYATQWQVSTDGGATWADVPQATSPAFSFVPTLADSGKQFRAVFTLDGATVVTHAATLTVIKATPVVVIEPVQTPAPFYEDLTFIVRVVSDGATDVPANGGVVEFSMGLFRFTATVRDGVATFVVPAGSRPGIYYPQATYDGTADPVFGSAYGWTTQVVHKAYVTVEPAVSDDRPAIGDPVTISAVIAQIHPGLDGLTGPNGIALFFGLDDVIGAARAVRPDSPPALPSTVTYTTRFTSGGGHSVVVHYLGDDWNEAADSNPISIVVDPAPTNLSVTLDPYPIVYYGQPIFFTVVATSPTGGIPQGVLDMTLRGDDGSTYFYEFAIDAAGRSEGYFQNYFTPGGYTATFVYSDPRFERFESATAAVGFGIWKGPTTLELRSSRPVSSAGDEVEFIATVRNTNYPYPVDDGLVDFYIGGVLVATVPVEPDGFSQARLATTALVPGVYDVAAVYRESTGLQGSVSEHVVQVVQPGSVPPHASTSTTLISSPGPSTAGEPVSFVAIVWSGFSIPTSGVVAFSIGGVVVAYEPVGGDGRATLTTTDLVPGVYTVTAAFLETYSHLGSESSPLVQVVEPAVPVASATTTSLATSLNPRSTALPLAWTVTVAGVGGAAGPTSGFVRFYVGLQAVAEAPIDAAGRVVVDASTLVAGDYLITAVYLGSDGFQTSQSDHLGQVVVAASPSAAAARTATASASRAVSAVEPGRPRRAVRFAQRRPPAMRGGR
ncbi:Ig-like domain repeat protein [Paludisphaera mucosa]|uniref:Ig-like domain repeat protein n=1 Tax=Paludisphaera mucosa TaxID=3030827 RepID=A0ABT6FGU0_9BACT|nr:Ig-like domain repeat protein [Paludisphaera mucosa]MDG3006789.1 Ig-like domain repeat protein [Paludisphaera mucosa]